MKSIIVACVALLAASLGGCTSYQLSQTSADGWGQIAQGAGQVIGSTAADQRVAEASAQLAKYCAGLQTVAAIGTVLAPDRYRVAAQQAQAAITTVCSSPPQDVQQTLRVAADAYAAVLAVKNGTAANGGV